MNRVRVPARTCGLTVSSIDGAHTLSALDEPTARGAIEEFLRRWVTQLTNPDRPPGCFTVQTGLTCSAENEFVRAELARRRSLGEVALRDRYRRADLDASLDLALTTLFT